MSLTIEQKENDSLIILDGREADRTQKIFVVQPSEAADQDARDIGFDRFPGETCQE
jgi:hypothetical protein